MIGGTCSGYSKLLELFSVGQLRGFNCRDAEKRPFDLEMRPFFTGIVAIVKDELIWK